MHLSVAHMRTLSPRLSFSLDLFAPLSCHMRGIFTVYEHTVLAHTCSCKVIYDHDVKRGGVRKRTRLPFAQKCNCGAARCHLSEWHNLLQLCSSLHTKHTCDDSCVFRHMWHSRYMCTVYSTLTVLVQLQFDQWQYVGNCNVFQHMHAVKEGRTILTIEKIILRSHHTQSRLFCNNAMLLSSSRLWL